MRVFVTGGSGYIGNAVVAALCRAGHAVTALVHTPEKAQRVERFGAKAVEGDIKKPGPLIPLTAEVDAIVHTAAEMSPDGGKIDQQWVSAVLDPLSQSKGRSRFIYTSGVWVLGDTGGRFVDENASTEKAAPIVAWRPAVEQMVLEAAGRGVTPCIIRPALVYGGAGGILAMLMASAEKEKAVRIVGEGRNHWTLVHVDDLADLYVRCVERTPAGQVFNASDSSRLTLRAIAEALSTAAGCYGKVNTTPLEEARKQMGPFADALALDQQVSGSLAQQLLGWEPRHRSLVGEADALYRAFKAGG
ncbi:MAG: NAD-dependent epimerase/dehydratase family protein [Candidatus Manganitrophus sp. SA1]|nr:NAD-dependent epimerase/dehydratase family protein [Candidatus Manganitrophus morganii]